jgi:hypothetical protein
MIKVVNKVKELILIGFFGFAGLFIATALCSQGYFVYLEFSGQQEKALRFANELAWKTDARFKSNPNNIWYTASNK